MLHCYPPGMRDAACQAHIQLRFLLVQSSYQHSYTFEN